MSAEVWDWRRLALDAAKRERELRESLAELVDEWAGEDPDAPNFPLWAELRARLGGAS